MPEVIEHSNADIYAIVRIEDPDEGRHGKVDSLEIVDGDAEAHFRIRQPSIDEPNEFNIEVLRLLDREISPYGYNLTLKVKKFLKSMLGPNFLQNESPQFSQILPLTRETETNYCKVSSINARYYLSVYFSIFE